jgi:SAM-dependent methyltransferase
MFEFHTDKKRYFDIQKIVTQEDVIPFIESEMGPVKGKDVLEIGCAEAGVLKAFIDHGNFGVGVELAESRYQLAREFLADDIDQRKAQIYNKNIYDVQDVVKEFGCLFDVIILKDVIEHIPEQEKFIPWLKSFLSPGGCVFFAYPPWMMPFGGHQQICKHKLLRTLPWFHLLPISLYTWILKRFGEKEGTIRELLEVKSTGINIERMYKILRRSGYTIMKESFWFTNPIYKFKFGFKKSHVFALLTKIPVFRNLVTTAHYVLFKVH